MRLPSVALLVALAVPALADPAKDPVRKAPRVLKQAEHGVGKLAPDVGFTDTTGTHQIASVNQSDGSPILGTTAISYNSLGNRASDDNTSTLRV